MSNLMSSTLTLILGGARSGKSAYAQQLAHARGGPHVLYVATALAFDDEMAARIASHRAERPAGWQTLEAAQGVGAAVTHYLNTAAVPPAVILVDCLTLLATNVLLPFGETPDPRAAEEAVLAEVDQLLESIRRSEAAWIVVSNEVGMGLVPPYPLGRIYRDALGRANQRLAAAAAEVLLMVAGLPWTLKSCG